MKYNFEFLVIGSSDQKEIGDIASFMNTLEGADSLLLERDIEHEQQLRHKNQTFFLNLRPFYEAGQEDDQAAYTLRGDSEDVKFLLEMRGKLLSLLSHKLKIPYIKTLNDDVSIYLSLQILPLIYKIEWSMRRLLITYYAYESGSDWWHLRAPTEFKNKLDQRHGEVASLQQLVSTDIELLSLEELGEVINNPNRYFLDTYVINRVQEIEDIEELEELKDELDNESNHPFQKAFTEKYFADKWKTMITIYRKTAHNQLLHPNDLSVAEQLFETLMRMIHEAKNLISEGDDEDYDDDESARDWKFGGSDLGSKGMENENLQKDEFEDLEPIRKNLRVITEEEILEELKQTEEIVEQTDMRYIGLKNFVTKILANKGYSIGPSYALINILNEQGIVEIYDYVDPHNPYPVKAVRTVL